MMTLCKKGSLTIEAAIILPVFALGLLAIVSILPMKQKILDIQEELFNDAMDVATEHTDGPEYRQLDVKCELEPLTGFFGPLKIPVERKCLVHVWNGYDRGYFSDGEYVYITKDSEVYHRDRDCSHIRLTVTQTNGEDILDQRNAGGSRYKPCELCHSRLSDPKLYITPEGDRYHNSITCSGLKRTVYKIRIEEAGDRRPCSRCGR